MKLSLFLFFKSKTYSAIAPGAKIHSRLYWDNEKGTLRNQME
jgi:hypothetical protein